MQFVLSQVRASMKKTRGVRWTTGDKALALSLLHSCPKTYRLLRKTFSLPSVTTLKKIMSRVHVYPGFNKPVLSTLKLKLSKLPQKARVVSVALDEMAIKEGLTYDRETDGIEGFDGESLANHALVFMVKGMVHKWKQPFGYFVSNGPMSGNRQHELLLQAIDQLEQIGLIVMLVICDQGSNNINMFKTRMGVTIKKPYFMFGNHKVFVLYDPPHLVKNIRNNLKKNGFLVDGESVAWQHVQDFYEKDSSKPIRLAPRLTHRHLTLPPFSPLRVKLATQVLSHSVASGMKVMIQWGVIDQGCAATAEFIESFDQLFNAFNSSTLTSTARMKHAFSDKSGHKEFLSEKLEWLEKIKSKGMFHLSSAHCIIFT